MRIIAISLFFAFTSAIPNSIYAQAQQVRVHGYVREATSGEALSYATVQQEDSGIGTHANDQGYYSLVVSPGPICLRASFAGYESVQQCFEVAKDTLIQINLVPTTLQAVEIRGKIPLHEQSILGFQRVSAQKINTMASFLGEPDVMRAITLVPGVSLGREGFGNLYVRGGDRGQNLVLLDGAPLYNTNHAGGLVGAVNGRIIKDMEVYKGGFPARFGGRASSVIDIRTRDGNKETHEASMYIGLVNSGFLVEGPLEKGKTSYLLAGRSSYLGLALLPRKLQFNDTNTGNYADIIFFDLNGKISSQINEKSRIYFAANTGHDLLHSFDAFENSAPPMRLESESRFSIDQTTATLGYQWAPTPRLFTEHRFSWSRYITTTADRQRVASEVITTRSELAASSLVRSISYTGKVTFDLGPNHSTEIGVETIRYRHDPGRINLIQQLTPEGPVLDTLITSQEATVGWQTDAFLEHTWKPSSRFSVFGGMRISSFWFGENSYHTWEPRVSAHWQVGTTTSLKANYSRMAQYIHVLIDNALGPEREVWVMANALAPPQISDQVSAGIFHSWPSVEIGVEGYYKRLDNLLFLKPLQNIADLGNWVDQLEPEGEGTAWGVELFGEYQQGSWQATLAYTFSRSERQFDNINSGVVFPHRFDRPHNLFLTGQWNIDADRRLTANFTFQSGTPFTLPLGYSPSTLLLPEYYASEGVNNVRLPPYHRLDLSYRKEKVKKNRRRYWSVNIYNVYARQNAAALVWRNRQLYQTTAYLIMPSFQWGIYF